MIKSITVKNFQCHSHKSINLQRITCLVGPTDSGKSAIIRAIRWAVFDRPNTAKLVKSGENTVECTIITDKGKIVRRRTNSENVYIINSRAYRSWRRNPPNVIASVINLSPVNFHLQHDPPFFVSSTPTERMKLLQQASGVELIDQIISRVNALHREKSAKKKHLQQQISELEQLIKAYDDVDERINCLQRIQSLIQRLEQLREKYQSVRQVASKIQKASRAAELLHSLQCIKRTCDELLELEKTYDKVRSFVSFIKDAEKTLQTTNQQLERTKRITKVCPLCRRPW